MNNIIIDSAITSIKVSSISVLITFFIAITFIYFNKYKKNKKKNIIDFLILLPMFIPPSAIGYIILISLGKNSFIGEILYKYFNIRIIFTIQACIIVSVIVTLPLMYQSIKNAIYSIDKDLINAGK
ncbi:MAG: ABC transporter permease subunit [Bacilli bacterium]|nr:ABC transporter permease subunit [Bacilli bacterium]